MKSESLIPLTLPQLAPTDRRASREAAASVAQTTVATLQEMIRDGRLPTGQALPAQRDLARDLGVSRGTLREAMSILATIGSLSIEQGRGTFVRDGRNREDAQSTPSWRFAARYSPEEVYQFRYVAESHAAQLAAMNHTDAELKELQDNLDVFRRATRQLNFTAYAQADFDFHRLIMRFSRNRLLADMHHTFANVLLESQRLPLACRDRLWEAVVEHERIVEALGMSDPDGARYYMRIHLSRAGGRAGIAIVELG